MSDNQIDDDQLIRAAAALIAQSANDERLVPLAQKAKEIVLSSDSAVLTLFLNYVKPPTPEPPAIQPAIGVAARTPNNEVKRLVGELKELLK